MENIELDPFDKTSLSMDSETLIKTSISRNGDLLHKVYLEITNGSTDFDHDDVGFNMIDHAEIEIGRAR